MSPRLLRAVGCGWAAVLALLTVVVFVLVLLPAKDAVLPTRVKHGLVFDTGSTHTSLYTYRWRADKENGTGIVSQVEACSVSGSLPALCSAFSGFYHSLHFLNLTGGQSLGLVNATIRQICNSSWKQVQELFPTASRTQLRDACAASSYILTLLLQGYKFNITTWPSIHFVQQVANTDVGWTLGYMLNLTNLIPSEPPTAVAELPRNIWVAATLLLAIMLILIFCLLTATCCHRNSSGYEQL
nr:ectonucleoside triphosphate diphosphohydrolase 8-like [Zonotrichia albicollis]